MKEQTFLQMHFIGEISKFKISLFPQCLVISEEFKMLPYYPFKALLGGYKAWMLSGLY